MMMRMMIVASVGLGTELAAPLQRLLLVVVMTTHHSATEEEEEGTEVVLGMRISVVRNLKSCHRYYHHWHCCCRLH